MLNLAWCVDILDIVDAVYCVDIIDRVDIHRHLVVVRVTPLGGEAHALELCPRLARPDHQVARLVLLGLLVSPRSD